jgi:hypothetical protein
MNGSFITPSRKGIPVYLVLALFWLGVGVLVQIFWRDLEGHSFLPVDRRLAGFGFFVLFSYNFLRWRMARVREQAIREFHEMPARPRRREEPIDPAFDFSEPNAEDKQKKDPPAG